MPATSGYCVSINIASGAQPAQPRPPADGHRPHLAAGAAGGPVRGRLPLLSQVLTEGGKREAPVLTPNLPQAPEAHRTYQPQRPRVCLWMASYGPQTQAEGPWIRRRRRSPPSPPALQAEHVGRLATTHLQVAGRAAAPAVQAGWGDSLILWCRQGDQTKPQET